MYTTTFSVGHSKYMLCLMILRGTRNILSKLSICIGTEHKHSIHLTIISTQTTTRRPTQETGILSYWGGGGGAFEQSLYSTHQSFRNSDPSLRCNAPEADTQIWLHAMHCVNTSGLNSLIVSADTDTAFIGIYHQTRSISRLIL